MSQALVVASAALPNITQVIAALASQVSVETQIRQRYLRLPTGNPQNRALFATLAIRLSLRL